MDTKYAQHLLSRTRQNYDSIADDFSRTRQTPWEELRFLFDDYIELGDKILDLGCGNGRFYEFCKDKNIEHIGIDNSEKLIEIAKQKYFGVKFQVADALDLPFPDGCFDKIYSIAVLHHIPSVELRMQFLGEARRVLKPGGLVILTVWKFHRWQEFLRITKYAALRMVGLSKLDFGDLFEPWDNKIQRYYHCFSQSELKRLVEKSGFRVKNIGVAKNLKGSRQNYYVVAEK